MRALQFCLIRSKDDYRQLITLIYSTGYSRGKQLSSTRRIPKIERESDEEEAEAHEADCRAEYGNRRTMRSMNENPLLP